MTRYFEQSWIGWDHLRLQKSLHRNKQCYWQRQQRNLAFVWAVALLRINRVTAEISFFYWPHTLVMHRTIYMCILQNDVVQQDETKNLRGGGKVHDQDVVSNTWSVPMVDPPVVLLTIASIWPWLGKLSAWNNTCGNKVPELLCTIGCGLYHEPLTFHAQTSSDPVKMPELLASGSLTPPYTITYGGR